MTVTTNNYAQSGVNELLQLGKNGHLIDGRNAGQIELTDKDGVLVKVKGAPASASDEFVTKTQLDAVNALAGGYLAYGFDASSSISQLSGQGSGASGAILYGDTFKVTTSGTFLGLAAEAGDQITALVAGADVSDDTNANTDWLLIEIRTAGDLADGVSTDHTNGKIIVKDGGISEQKMAALSVSETKMIDDSVSTRTIVARSVTGAKIAIGTIIDENVATGTLTEVKLHANVQAKLSKAVAAHDTRIPNIVSAIGGFDSDNDSAIAAQANYLVATTITGQLGQADARLKTVYDDNLLRKVNATFNGGTQNLGAAIKSGRVLLRINMTPITVANGANCSMTIGVSGDVAKYVSADDINLELGQPHSFPINKELSSDEQLIVTVTQGTATQGTFLVTAEHG